MKILCSIVAFARLAGMSISAAMIFVVAAAAPAEAQLRVDITRGTVEPMPIAIPEFFGKTPQEIDTGRKMANLISADLERSGLFRPIDRRAFIQKVAALRVKVKARVDEVANVQSHVKLVTEGIRELMQLDPGGSSKQRSRGGFDQLS